VTDATGETSAAGGPVEHEHHVTVVVSDLQGSTALAEGLDPESLRLVLDRYFDELGAVLESYGGRIEKRIGDMMVTVFGLPEAHPGDALRALRAAAEAQQTLESLNHRLRATWGVQLVNRTGIDSGTVVMADAGGAHRVLAGPAFENASALEPIAPALEVLVSQRTVAALAEAREAGLVSFGPAEELRTKAGEPVAAHRLESVAEADDDWTPAVDLTDGSGPTGAARRDRRSTVTIVFADLHVESADGHGPVGDAAGRAALVRAFDVARDALERHGGIVEKFIGDAVMAVYGLDRRHEDDALRAARAALDMQEGLAGIARELEELLGVHLVARIGVNTGPVVAGDPTAGERLVTGDAVNVAARLEQTAHPGAVVIGALTRRLVGPAATVLQLEPLTLKGKAEPVPAFRLWSLDGPGDPGAAGAGGTRGRFELPLLGRDPELTALGRAWTTAREQRRWQRVDLVGEAGIGKSRLVYELLDGIDPDTRVLRGTCPAYGRGITFWSIAEVVRQTADISAADDPESARRAIVAAAPDAEVAERLWALLGLSDRIVPVAELMWSVRLLLEHVAASRPLVVVIDALHLAEPTLLELLEEVTAHDTRVPALLLTMSRGRDEVGAGAADGAAEGGGALADDALTLFLEPLDTTTCNELVAHALGPDTLPPVVRAKIATAAAGVPLFVEQLLTMLIDDGIVEPDVGTSSGWRATAAIGDLSVPPTVEAILAARIDALGDDERATLESASVVGREFGQAAVGHLVEAHEEAGLDDAGLDDHQVDEAVSTLRRRQLVTDAPRPGALVDHRFRSQLLRDVTYEGLLKRTRAQLHLLLADWLLGGPAAGRLVEFEELIGHHLERSWQLDREVGAMGAEVEEVGRRASGHLAAAGHRALARGDMPAASSLLGRAAATLPAGDPGVARLLVPAGDAAFEEGAFDVATQRWASAGEIAAAAGDEVTAASARLARTTMAYLTGDGVEGDEALAMADAAEAVFTSHAHDAGVARCWRLRANVELTGCRWGAAEQAAIATIEAARRAGDRVLELRILPALAGFSLYGPTPVPEALARSREVLAAVGDDRRARALTERTMAHLMALDGDLDTAREVCADTRVRLAELGWTFDAALVSIDLGPIEMMAGRPDAAEDALRADHDLLDAMGEHNYISTTTYLLAEAVRRQGRHDEALALTEEAEAAAADDDIGSQAGWRGVRSRVLLASADPQAALGLAEEALELLLVTDDMGAHGEAYLDRAAARLALGDRAGATDDVAASVAAYAAKGHRPGLARAEVLQEELSRPGR